MNKERRKSIDEIIQRLNNALTEIESASEDIDNLKSEEEEYKDNIPESMQNGEKYCLAEEAIENMDSAITSLDGLADSITEAIEYLETSKG